MVRHERNATNRQGSRNLRSPMLSVHNGARAVEFYQLAFGAQIIPARRLEGRVVARLPLGKSDFWLADESPEHFNFSPETLGGGTSRMVVIVRDPDAVSEKAVAAGAKVVWPVSNQSYGWRLGRIGDPFGHHWEIGKPLTDDQDLGWAVIRAGRTHYFPRIRLTNSFINRSASEARQTRALSGNWS